MSTKPNVPKWFVALIIAAILPALSTPELLNVCPPDIAGARTLIWIYPIYSVIAGYLAYQCYPTRREVSWILIALILLSHAAMWILTNADI